MRDGQFLLVDRVGLGNLETDFHRGVERAVQARVDVEDSPERCRAEEPYPVDRDGVHLAARMVERDHAGGHVHEAHQVPAEGVVERVRVVRMHDGVRLGLRILDLARGHVVRDFGNQVGVLHRAALSLSMIKSTSVKAQTGRLTAFLLASMAFLFSLPCASSLKQGCSCSGCG